MDIEQLKNNWRSIGESNSERQRDLIQSAVNNNSSLKRLKYKQVIESICLFVLLWVFYGAFDGAAKPLWVNALLVLTMLLYILTRVIGVYWLHYPVKAGNLQHALENFRARLTCLTLASSVTALTFGLALIVFLSINIHFTVNKWIMLVGLMVTLVIMVYVSHRVWWNKCREINQIIQEFKE